MPSIKDLFPDKWLRPEHLRGRAVTVAVQGAQVEQLFNPRSRRNEPKLVLEFHGKQLRLPLNKTQAHAMAAITNLIKVTVAEELTAKGVKLPVITSSVERGMWKLVIRTSTTFQSYGRRMNRSVRPASSPVVAADSRARTDVVPTATTRRASLQASRVSAGTR